jgi:predicted outer membrane lipoprotein
MCQSSPPMSEVVLPMIRHSVHEFGIVEALRYKWIESEKAGRDLGETAIRSWVRQHWNGFLRARWLEHLEGRTFWVELDQDDYGLLQHAFLGYSLIEEVLDRLKDGQENLDLIIWALDDGHDLDQLIEILELLDVNSRRIECLFCVRLAQAG